MKRLKELREDMDMTQAELASILMQSKSNISKYENGQIEPNIDTIIALARFFKVTTDYLLGVSDIKNPYSITMDDINEALDAVTRLNDKIVDMENKLSGKENERFTF